MPFCFSLHLLAPASDVPVPPGQQVRGLVYDLINLGAPQLAEEIHALPEFKPFTVSPLRRLRQRDGGGSSPHRYLRLTTLRTDVASAILQAVATLQLAGDGLTLGEVPHALDLAAGVVRQQRDLPYEALIAAPPATTADLLVRSPAAFRADDRNVPLPLPEPLLRSLVGKWNAFSSTGSVDEVLMQALLQTVVLARHDIRTSRLRLSDRHEVGFIGRIRLKLHDNRPELQRLFATLMYFSDFAGIGARCTLGMGQVKVLAVR